MTEPAQMMLNDDILNADGIRAMGKSIMLDSIHLANMKNVYP